MRLMILSTLGIAALAVGIACCPPLKARMDRVVFGQAASAEQKPSDDHLMARTADKVKQGAMYALECVQAKAVQLTGSGDRQPDPKAAPPPKQPSDAPPDPRVQQKS